ncbi:MAG: PepSY domain-containing protein [Solirubrobacterales bacterium]|nr:PepSY domain-containing protein [Solirubrobacterales bacterium]
MDKLKGVGIAVAALAAIAVGGTAIAGAAGAGGDDDAAERAITGPALVKAERAALAHTGGGQVTGTEAGDEEGAYEVEVTGADGRQVDVHLDRDFSVLSQVTDDDRGGEDAPNDD